MQCSSCGKVNAADSRFCVQCGQASQASPSVTAPGAWAGPPTQQSWGSAPPAQAPQGWPAEQQAWGAPPPAQQAGWGTVPPGQGWPQQQPGFGAAQPGFGVPPPQGGGPYYAPVTAPTTAAQVYEVARNFRALLQWFGLQLGSYVAMMAVSVAMGGNGHNPDAFAALVVLGFALAVIAGLIGVLISIYRLATAMGSGVAILWVLGMFVPCLSLILLIVMNSNATAWLSARGIQVGFLGPSQQVVEQARQQAGLR